MVQQLQGSQTILNGNFLSSGSTLYIGSFIKILGSINKSSGLISPNSPSPSNPSSCVGSTPTVPKYTGGVTFLFFLFFFFFFLFLFSSPLPEPYPSSPSLNISFMGFYYREPSMLISGISKLPSSSSSPQNPSLISLSCYCIYSFYSTWLLPLLIFI